jgi:hypothetical protein
MDEISSAERSFDEIILLGDIFDFWRVRPEKAVRDSIYFLKRLAGMGSTIRYVVGNHDHHLVVLNQEKEFLERMARGDIYPVYVPSLRWSQTIDGHSIEMHYPTYQTSCCRRTFLFTHGHHLNGIQAFSLQMVERLRRASGEELLPDDLEMMMTYAYESLYRSAYIGEMLDLEARLWKASGLLHRFREGVRISSNSFVPVERDYDAVQKFLRDRNLLADGFVYGDTHCAGICQKKGGPLVVNSGCFTREQGRGHCPETPNTYVVLNEDGLALRRLGQKAPLYMVELL